MNAKNQRLVPFVAFGTLFGFFVGVLLMYFGCSGSLKELGFFREHTSYLVMTAIPDSPQGRRYKNIQPSGDDGNLHFAFVSFDGDKTWYAYDPYASFYKSGFLGPAEEVYPGLVASILAGYGEPKKSAQQDCPKPK